MSTDAQSDSEEEIIVYAEFSNVNIEKYRSIHVLGIDNKNPVIQADDTFFSGKFVQAQGTYMFFEEDPCSKSADPLFDKLPEKNLKYVFKTNKLLQMENAYVSSKADNPVKTEANEQIIDDVEEVKFKSLEEAFAKFTSAFPQNPDVCLDLETKTQMPMEIDNAEESDTNKNESPT